MKVGILTLPLHINYGGILQAYALQYLLKRMGHEVTIIDKSQKRFIPIYKWPFSYTKRLFIKYILRENQLVFSEQYHNKTYPIISQNIQNFIKMYLQRVEINNLSTLKENDFEAIVVGSDQIWRPSYYKKIEEAYLSFAQDWDIKRVSYAPSFGTDLWEYTNIQTKKCKELVRLFDAVSVREKSGVKLCKDYFNIEAVHVLDPTLLLDMEEYIKLINNINPPLSSGNLLCYILDETDEKRELINKISEEKLLVPFRVNSKAGNHRTPLEDRIQPSIEQWLRGFYDAKFIITDSFHACAFSIIFNKPFLVVGNRARGLARFESFLQVFNLKNRLVNSVYEYSLQSLNDINWEEVNEILRIQKEFSFQFLSNALKK
ncbi:MAG: polysaccharide pyruvyl transferase family protein [Bacteroidetes bacterium]|nr:polysaccharide pyruvyl transferase family protein [Bacteroidota bacterium]